jgi:hypothetical protein
MAALMVFYFGLVILFGDEKNAQAWIKAYENEADYSETQTDGFFEL